MEVSQVATGHVRVNDGELEPFNFDAYSRLLRARYKWGGAVLNLIAVLTVAIALGSLVPFLRNNLLTLLIPGDLSDPNPNSGASGTVLVILSAIIVGIFLFRRHVGFNMAYKEELRYRRGAENWSWAKRGSMCARFGLVHFWNVVVPICFVFAIALGGVYLMSVYLLAYRRTGHAEVATMVAAHYHYAYNMVASVFIGTALLIALVSTILSLL